VGPSGGLETVAKNPDPTGNRIRSSNPKSSHYTKCAIPVRLRIMGYTVHLILGWTASRIITWGNPKACIEKDVHITMRLKTLIGWTSVSSW